MVSKVSLRRLTCSVWCRSCVTSNPGLPLELRPSSGARDAMIQSLRDVLIKQAPDLFARTKLPRSDPDYLTQRQAFDLHRERRFDDLAHGAPDLVERMKLPGRHPQHLTP